MSAPYTNFAQLQQQGYARPPEPTQATYLGAPPLTTTADNVGGSGTETEEERKRREAAAAGPTPQPPPQPGQQSPTATQPAAQPGMPAPASPPPPPSGQLSPGGQAPPSGPMPPPYQAPPPPPGGQQQGSAQYLGGQQQNSTGYGTMIPQPPPQDAPQQPQSSFMDPYQGMWNAYQSYMPYAGPSNFQAPMSQQTQLGVQSAYQPGQIQSPGYMAQQGPNAYAYNPFQYQQSLPENMTGMAVAGNLMNPNRYDRQLAQDVYGDMSANLQRDFGAQQQLINEDSARRGIYYSTIPAGRLGDLATNQAQQMRGFATDITREAANVNAADQSSAIQNALGYGSQRYGQQQGQYATNLGAQGQQFGQQMQGAQFGADERMRQEQMRMQLAQANAALGQQGFENQFALAQNQDALRGSDFQRQMQRSQFGLGQQGQNFAQQQQALQSMLGYGQQGFQNQLAQAQFNAQQQQMYDQMLMNLYGGMA